MVAAAAVADVDMVAASASSGLVVGSQKVDPKLHAVAPHQLAVCQEEVEEGNCQDPVFARQAEEAVVRILELLAACSTHNNDWVQPSFLVFLGFLVCKCPDIALVAGVASPPDPHMSTREV